jgi:hypothetical protein
VGLLLSVEEYYQIQKHPKTIMTIIEVNGSVITTIAIAA